MNQQGNFTKGIYEYADPSGTLLVTKIPTNGTADLYSGTRVIVRPNQAVIFVYNGKITEVLPPGNHEIHTENFPILTKLANWRFGFESPLRCELWFISMGLFTSRLWGTSSPVLLSLPVTGTMPVRVHGNFNIRVKDAKGFFLHFISSQSSFDITELETFVQAQIIELLPIALKLIEKVQDISTKQDLVSEKLEELINRKLAPYGIMLEDTQVRSILPPDEVLEALDQKLAMDVIGDKKEYLLYKVANSLDHMKQGGGQSGDQTQLLMTMMLGKSLLGEGIMPQPQTPKLPEQLSAPGYITCSKCNQQSDSKNSFCPKCGNKL